MIIYPSLAHKCPREKNMATEYYVIRKRAVPEVLLKVVQADRLLKSGAVSTVQEAVDRAGISRSSYYKFKNDIEEFHDSVAGTTVTLSLDINDETGILSDILKVIARSHANILTIHQSIPVSGVANVSISLQVEQDAVGLRQMINDLEELQGVRKLRITGRQDT